jgi:curved DNA-binding protein CbpA
MTRAEALSVLGLEEGASAEDVRRAHRRLIVLVHPDRGGTPYLAARLNQARDVLLGGGGG